MQAKNRDKIVRDKAAGVESGRRRKRSGRQGKIDEGETSHVDFTERDHSTDGWLTDSKNMTLIHWTYNFFLMSNAELTTWVNKNK